MKLIVQQNFTSGLGDGVMAMIDYINAAKDLKNLGYQTKLLISMKGNLYFKEKNLFDYLDILSFSVFDEIDIVPYPIMYNTKQDGYTCAFTHRGASPGSHYWDLFVDDGSEDFFKKNYSVSQFDMSNLVSGKKPELIPILNKSLISEYEQFVFNNNLSDFDSIYFRTKDMIEEIDYLETKKGELIYILNQDKKFFVCSINKEFKKFIKSLNKNNVYFLDIPLEDIWGGNHLVHPKLDSETLHNRTKITFLEMWILSKSKNINFFTTWNRYSNFMVYAPINNSKITFK